MALSENAEIILKEFVLLAKAEHTEACVSSLRAASQRTDWEPSSKLVSSAHQLPGRAAHLCIHSAYLLSIIVIHRYVYIVIH